MDGEGGGAAAPLDWPSLVEEAVRRRRQAGMTASDHAAAANLPDATLAIFDRRETSLTLADAIALLRVVGLIADGPPASAQSAFIVAAIRHWETLVAPFPGTAAIRQPFGHYAFDYRIVGVAAPSYDILLEALKRADRKYTGWPPFGIPSRPSIAPYPYPVDRAGSDQSRPAGVECWLGRDTDRLDRDTAHSDFWRASLDGRLYIRRGYQEDAVAPVPPASLFDLTLPLWHAGEALLHAQNLALALGAGPSTEIRFRAHYTGLDGRELKSWANPNRELFGAFRCRTAEGTGIVYCQTGAIDAHLPDLVLRLLKPIYELFSFFQLPMDLVGMELDRLRTAHQARKSPSRL